MSCDAGGSGADATAGRTDKPQRAIPITLQDQIAAQLNLAAIKFYTEEIKFFLGRAAAHRDVVLLQKTNTLTMILSVLFSTT